MTDNDKNIRTWLFNPHYFIAGWQALILGLVFIAASGYVGSFSSTQFDGLLDIHLLPPAPWTTVLSEGFLDWFVLVVLLYIGGKILSESRIRAIDVLGTQAVARFPGLISVTLLLFTKPAMVRYFQTPNHPALTQDVVVFWLTMTIIVAMLAWMLRLMIQGFAVACNVDMKQGKSKAVFWGAVVVAEFATKAILFRLFQVN